LNNGKRRGGGGDNFKDEEKDGRLQRCLERGRKERRKGRKEGLVSSSSDLWKVGGEETRDLWKVGGEETRDLWKVGGEETRATVIFGMLEGRNSSYCDLWKVGGEESILEKKNKPVPSRSLERSLSKAF
jgi:hypothetical protein